MLYPHASSSVCTIVTSLINRPPYPRREPLPRPSRLRPKDPREPRDACPQSLGRSKSSRARNPCPCYHHEPDKCCGQRLHACCVYSHSGYLADSITTSDGFATISLALNNLLQFSLGKCPSLSDSTCAVSIVDTRRLDAEKLGTSLVYSSNQRRNTKGPDGTVAGVSLTVTRKAIGEDLL